MSREASLKPSSDAKPMSLMLALLPVVVLIGLLVINVIFFQSDASYGPNQIALLMAAAAAVGVGLCLGIQFKNMLQGIVKSLGSAISAMLILLMIGSLAGTWMMGGIVPAMIYYGLEILNPQFFLVAALGICAIVSVATGSSWSTVATVGIALIAIGKVLGISEAMSAGAIISGAYFGDKISPLSDTTNLASAMAGTELFTHIKYMLWTTVPSILIAAGIFTVLGLTSDTTVSTADTNALRESIASRFNISLWLLLVPAAVIVMVVLKFDALVALFIGALLGAIVAIAFQPEAVKQISGLADPVITTAEVEVDGKTEEVSSARKRSYLAHAYVAFINSMALETQLVADSEFNGILEAEKKRQLCRANLTGEEQSVVDDANLNELAFDEKLVKPALTPAERLAIINQSQTDILESDQVSEERKGELAALLSAQQLLKGKGMEGMLNTIWLIICAMCFGGVMEACGMLQRLTQPLINLARSTGSLIATTAGSCLFVNITASDQYLAIVVPGRMFRETYAERGLAPQNLSRTLEDSGTVTSVLVPWNTCGVTQAGVLGVATMMYAPYCFFNLISPLMTIAFGFAGIGIAKLSGAVVGSNEDDEKQPEVNE